MKSEELLNSLDHIGEDLLAEAEQNILVRTRRPWLKTAVAAVLVAAIGVGGWLTLNHFTMKSSVQATNPVSATEPAQQTTEPVQSVTLPMLEIGDSWETLPLQREHCRSENAITFSDPAVTALPVYTVDPEHDDFSYYRYNESQLRSILNETLRSLGVSRTGEFRPVHQSNDSSEDLVFINMEVTTGIGTISVTPAGSIYLEFTEPRNLSEIKELLNYPADSYVYSTDAAMDQRQLRLIPALDEPVEQLLVWFFGGVYLYTDQADLNTAGIEAISWYYRANEAWSGYSEPWRVCLGDYPLLSLEEARAYALNGYYLSSDYFYGPLTEELLTDVELIYSEFNFPQNKISGIQLPYYRFWINTDLFGECSVCVPAIRPEYLSDFPQPHSDDVEVTEPEPTEPEPSVMDPETLEQTLSEWERGLNGEYFSCYLVQDSYYNYYGSYFSDGSTRIWQENDAVLKKDLSTGEIETLFSLEPNAEIKTALLGVTAKRLYFGWNEAGNWWGKNVYSVDYHNENRVDWYDAQEVYFGDGWLRMESFRSDVRSFSLHVIDRNDELVVDYSGRGYYGDGGPCWGDRVVDGSLYFVKIEGLFSQWVESLSDAEREAVTDEAWEAKRQHEQYTLFRLDPDGSISAIGSIEAPVTAMFHIDTEARELVNDCDGFYRYDLFTLEPIDDTAELPEDLHELVVEDFSAQDRYTDDCGNVMDYSYSIPRLDANTQGARAINAAIGKQTEELRQWAEEHEDGGYSISVYSLSYEVYVWQDVVSVVMKKSYYYDYTEYFVYCYDSATGRRLDTAELLEKLGVSEAIFLEACRTKFREKYQALTGSIPEEERSQYEKDFPDYLPDSPKRVNLELAVYPDESGELIAVAPITSWVGAAFYYHLIPVLDIQN